MATKRKTPTKDPATLHVLELRAENVMRLKAITIKPTGELVIIGGRNEQGKTSTLGAIEMALAGKRAIPAVPLRQGARKGSIFVDLGEYRVERTFTPEGTKLSVTDADGVPVRSPQAALDAIYSSLSFDPLEFARMDPRDQDATLKAALGLDFSDIERKRAAAYERRTVLNRECKRLEGELAALPQPRADTPDKEVSITELVNELASAQACHTKLAANEQETRRLKTRLDQLRAEAEDVKKQLAICADAKVALGALALACSDTDDLAAQLNDAEETNRQVRLSRERGTLEGKLVAVEEQLSDLNADIRDADAEKEKRLAEADFPVEGLGFDEGGVTLDGLPFKQASTARKLRVSVALGAAINPRCKVMLVREGSSLDAAGLELLATLARETDSQVWVEKVSEDGAGCSILIEDGMIKGESK